MMFFFFNDTATTEIYTLSLHDALPISEHDGLLALLGHHRVEAREGRVGDAAARAEALDDLVFDRAEHRDELRRHREVVRRGGARHERSEEHTSELQSRQYLVCRLLLEKKKKITYIIIYDNYNPEK